MLFLALLTVSILKTSSGCCGYKNKLEFDVTGNATQTDIPALGLKVPLRAHFPSQFHLACPCRILGLDSTDLFLSYLIFLFLKQRTYFDWQKALPRLWMALYEHRALLVSFVKLPLCLGMFLSVVLKGNAISFHLLKRGIKYYWLFAEMPPLDSIDLKGFGIPTETRD